MSPEPTTPTREDVEASANAALDECATLTDGDIKVMARWIKQHLTNEPAPQANRPAADVTDAWRKPPPHFKPNTRWQRQPQSDEEWDAHKDAPGMREFRAKRRLAFAGDLADPRTPECMALVSRLDLSVVLSRLTWLEARFENTRETVLPPSSQPSGTASEGME